MNCPYDQAATRFVVCRATRCYDLCMRKGIGVSPGVAVGTAYCIHEIFVNPDTKRLAERRRSGRNLAATTRPGSRPPPTCTPCTRKWPARSARSEAAIFRAHESILHDPAFTAKIRGWIVDDRETAPAALDRVLDEYTALFARTEDEYLRERLADVRDVIIRLQRPSVRRAPADDREALPGPLILVADELLPSQVVTLGKREVAGIVTQAGGQTSHAAILARSRGIPAVSGVRGILRNVKNGDTVVVDGREGHVIVNPDAEADKRLSQAAARVLRPEGRAGREPRSAGRHGRRPAGRTAGQHQQPGRRPGRRGHGRRRASGCSAPSTCS